VLAEDLYTPRSRQTMHGIAATYEKLAQQLERRAGDRDNDKVVLMTAKNGRRKVTAL
jgi:hypothetical protein